MNRLMINFLVRNLTINLDKDGEFDFYVNYIKLIENFDMNWEHD